jgi:hypothetical protein
MYLQEYLSDDVQVRQPLFLPNWQQANSSKLAILITNGRIVKKTTDRDYVFDIDGGKVGSARLHDS